ncbi:MAG: sigma-70 family RNA polymerase sigma factor [Planctomycetota bacterium]
MNDRDLVKRYTDGDEGAFDALYDRYRTPLYGYLVSLSRSRELAEELLQETFLTFIRQALKRGSKLLESADGSPIDGGAKPILFRIARSRWIDRSRVDQRRFRAMESRASDPSFLRDDRNEAPWAVDASLDADAMQSRLDGLPEEQRETLLLRAIGGLTFPEIGRLMGVSQNTALSRFRYATQKLRDAMSNADTRTQRRDRR